jgi:hypothetical protein
VSNLWYRRFDEHLQLLGLPMAPVAWDLAKFPWKSDMDRYAVLDEITRNEKKADQIQ